MRFDAVEATGSCERADDDDAASSNPRRNNETKETVDEAPTMASRGASPDIMGGRPLPPRSGEVDSDDDGLGDHDSEVTDDEGLYEDGAETEGEGDDTSKDGPRPGRIGGRYKIQHATGDFKMQRTCESREDQTQTNARPDDSRCFPGADERA